MAFLVLGVGSSAAGAQEHPGWPTDAILKKVAELLGSEHVEERAGKEILPMMLLDPTEEASGFAGPEDRVRAFVVGEFSSMLLMGDDTSVHTFWFYFPILGMHDTDAAFVFYDSLLTHLFPDWSGANGWALRSLQTALEKGAAAFEDPTISLNAMIAREDHAGALLAGWGSSQSTADR